MGVTLAAVTAIGKEVAAEHGGLTVYGVTLSDGSTDRVEVLVAIAGCHEGQCRLMINVTRADGAQFERDFRTKLRDALVRHRSAAKSE